MSASDEPDDVYDDVGFGSASAVFWFLVVLAGVALFVWDFGNMVAGSLSAPGFPISVIDNLKVTLMTLEILGGGGTIVVMGYLIWRYAAPRREAPSTLRPGSGKYTLTMWALGVLFLMVMAIFMGAGALALTDENPHPANTVSTSRELNMEVVGAQWTWRMKVDGVPFVQSQQVILPANTLIHFAVTSGDVIHSFAIQSLGIKKDAIPGQTNHASFMVDSATPHDGGVDGGETTTISAGGQQIQAIPYQINCAELCGKGHSQMVATMYIVSPEDYQTWAKANNASVPDSFMKEAGGGGMNMGGS